MSIPPDALSGGRQPVEQSERLSKNARKRLTRKPRSVSSCQLYIFSNQIVIPFTDRFYLFQIKNDPVRHTRESGYPVVQRLPGFPPSRE